MVGQSFDDMHDAAVAAVAGKALVGQSDDQRTENRQPDGEWDRYTSAQRDVIQAGRSMAEQVDQRMKEDNHPAAGKPTQRAQQG